MPAKKSTHRSTHVLMRSQYIALYALVDGKKQGNHEQLQPDEEIAEGAAMSETYTTHADHGDQHEPGLYEIRLKGHLDDRRVVWFAGMTLTREDNGDTLLTGPVIDQAALHGLLRKVRDLGMPLIAVTRVSPGQTAV
jgi:hypothetical protein